MARAGEEDTQLHRRAGQLVNVKWMNFTEKTGNQQAKTWSSTLKKKSLKWKPFVCFIGGGVNSLLLFLILKYTDKGFYKFILLLLINNCSNYFQRE